MQQIKNYLTRTRKYSFYPFTEIKKNFALSSDVILLFGESELNEPFKFSVKLSESGITGVYNANLYKEESIGRFLASLQAVILALAEGQRLSEIEIISGKDLDLIKSFNDNTVPLDRELTIVDMLRAQAARTPERTAVVYGDNSYTYRELDEITDRIARFRQLKVWAGDKRWEF